MAVAVGLGTGVEVAAGAGVGTGDGVMVGRGVGDGETVGVGGTVGAAGAVGGGKVGVADGPAHAAAPAIRSAARTNMIPGARRTGRLTGMLPNLPMLTPTSVAA
ncbi:MAG: hypothetical protein O3B04_06460 [Chloroflexi bacterium]|nr:hypothetical protein [Chloroflexota bacterium]MDA1297628.1 hypothetical protein [Chloroflexota bacterium]